MALFDFIKRLLGGEKVSPVCPNCGFGHSWNGRRCLHCQFPNHRAGQSPSSVQNRDYTSPAAQSSGEIVDAVLVSSGENQPLSTSLGGLETDKFKPITMDEALDQTQSADWRTAYLDSMGIIPSADIPRIKVIDQTMVGLGLISPKELAEIHQIGDEYDKYRTDYGAIELAGHQAVVQSREEKARLKQQKKEEAAARKKEHEEAVAHRRATDIFFLGRGVSKGLADRRANIESLNEKGLPVLATPGEFAKAFGINVPRLKWLAFHNIAATRVHYVHFSVPKKSGGLRTISVPHREMKAVQQWIFENILKKLQPHDNAHGFVPSRSTVTNARPHVGADIVINVDLKSFFPSINFHRVDGLFKSLGYSPAVATIMALLCTECPRETVKLNGTVYHVATGKRGLPQGACTSPAISNLIARHLDLRLSGMAEKLGWTYTRYADDITYSRKLAEGVSKEENHKMTGYVLARLRHIADDEGFAINEKKTRVLRSHTQQSVTGIVVNDRVGISRKTVRQLRAILHNAKKDGLESQNRDGRENFAEWLSGMIAYVEMVNAEQGSKLRKSFEDICFSK